MSGTLVGIIRFLHIMSSVAWVGGVLFWATIIGPNVMRRGPPTMRQPFLETMLAPLTRFLVSSGLATIVFGFLLVGAMNGWDFGAAWRVPTYGSLLGIGALAAIVLLLHGSFVTRPAGHKLLSKMQSLPPGPPSAAAQAELATLGKGVAMHGMISVLLGTIALACMVAAVNVVR